MLLKEYLYPELRLFTVDERVRVLHEAKTTPFDVLELFGMAAGLVIVTAVTRYAGSELDSNQRFAASILNFLLAIPLLALAVGPFLVRRVRRGLRAQLKHDEQP